MNKLVSFASSNPDVASVDANGIVTAHAAGAVTITATADSGISAECIIVVSMPNTLNLPASTNQVQSEAFLTCAAEMVILPAGCESIGERGFANCANLAFVYIPESVTSIAEDAFNGCVSLKIICAEGSYAQEYAQRHGITCIIP